MQSKEAFEFDDETFSVIRVKNFREMLSRLEVDVLALFGERDTNVDWRKARALYESAIGEQAEATLTVRTFPECNHGMNESETGSVREVEGTPLDSGVKCDGYYQSQLDWLREYVVGE
jgi:dienelactone hydrolase